jgi:HD superfamily phosphohydrolase
LPPNPETGESYQHEDYSIAAIKFAFPNIIAEYPEVIELIAKNNQSQECRLLCQIISGQVDADRMDYLLRDAHHAGLPYGQYDWRRIVSTVDFFELKDDDIPRIGVRRGGRHAAESLLLARYMMFNCAYNHRTRVIIDFHLGEILRELLPNGFFPPPTSDGIRDYLAWDDWRMLGALASGGGGDHGRRLVERRFHRQVWSTPELPSAEELIQFEQVKSLLSDLKPEERDSSRAWYVRGGAELIVQAENDDEAAVPLSRCSNVIAGLRRSERHRLFVSEEARDQANRRLACFPLKREQAKARTWER